MWFEVWCGCLAHVPCRACAVGDVCMFGVAGRRRIARQAQRNRLFGVHRLWRSGWARWRICWQPHGGWGWRQRQAPAPQSAVDVDVDICRWTCLDALVYMYPETYADAPEISLLRLTANRSPTGKTGVTADRDKIEFRLFNSSSIFNITLREELFSLPKKNQTCCLVLVSWC